MEEALEVMSRSGLHDHVDCREMAVLTTYFNPCGYHNLRRNYWEFRKRLGVALHTIELSFDGTFEIPDALQVSGGRDNLLWQKERLLNLLADTLPDDVTERGKKGHCTYSEKQNVPFCDSLKMAFASIRFSNRE
jgi:hypothetical protein